ncbi:hypothetical protein ABFP37_20115, partial [Burkholderia sp. RS01]|uniref:hypothetical protein n=1 Tax=unclassified Burkholderia TaxID=2613784 RepID=UPI003218B1E9
TGINKLGTLLSSQTTDTPGTTTTKQPWIAPEQLFKLTRFQPPTQIHVPGPTPTNKTSPTRSRHAKQANHSQAVQERDLAASGHQLLAGPLAAT